MNWTRTLVVICIALVVCTMVTEADTATVTVDGAVEHQTIKGGGTAFGGGGIAYDDMSYYPIPLRDVAAQTYALGFRMIRSDIESNGSCYPELNNDDGDPFNCNWDSGPNSFNAQFAAADAGFRHSKTLRDAGLEILVNFYCLPQWMIKQNGANGELDSSIPGIYDEVAEFWAAFLTYGKNNYGVNFQYLGIHHEPTCDTSTNWTAGQIRDAIKKVGARLDAEGLITGIVAPKCALASYSQTYLQTILSDATAASHIDVVSFHAYDHNINNPTQMRNLANDALIKASGLPIWQTEWVLQKTAQYPKRSEAYIETFAYALEWARFIHYCYTEGQCCVTTQSPGVAMEYAKDEGMFGPGLGPGGLRLKKFGHAITQYHRFIEPGSRRIDASVFGASNVLVSAYKHPVSGALAIVMLNKSTSSVSVTVNLDNLSAPASTRAVRTSATQESIELSRLSVSGGSFTVDLPGESVTTYVGSTVADSTAPSVPVGVGATAVNDTMVRVTWDPSPDNVAVVEYRVFRDNVEIGTTTGTSYLDSGLKGATDYSYTVLAFDLAGNESVQSATAAVTTPADTTAPAVPKLVVATAHPNAVTITWAPNTDSVKDHDLSGFRVYTADAPGGPYDLLVDLSGSDTTGYTHSPVVSRRQYGYVVTSYDDEISANESAYSEEVSATPYPRVPGGLQADFYDSAWSGAWSWFDTLKTGRIDATVDFNWEIDTPPAGRYITGLYGTVPHWCMFGVRWQGEVLADATQTYTFQTHNLDGARLWVDGKIVIDDWAGWFTHTNVASLPLTAGWHAIRLDYYRYHPEVGEDGVIQLYYSSASVSKQIIPADHLATVNDSTIVNITLTASADSWIQDENGNSRDGNMGALDIMAVGGRWHTTYFRGFIKFDLSSIPCNATISSARLQLYHTMNAVEGSNVNNISVYGVLRDWKEHEVTWNHYAAAAPWTAPGAGSIGKDRENTPLAEQSFASATPVYQYYDFDVTSAIQDYIDGVKPNYGFILVGKEAPAANRYFTGFSTKESASNPPLLYITYTPPPGAQPPIQVAIDDAGDGDTIVIEPGHYCENINFKGKNLTLRSTDPNDPAVVAATVIKGRGHGLTVTFSSGEDADCILAGFTITNVNAGIYCSGASPTITNCCVTDNSGAGIELRNGSKPTITKCRIAANAGNGIEMWPEHSGRLTVYNYPTITNSVIAGNLQHGIVGGIPTITNCTIVANQRSGISGLMPAIANSIIYYNDAAYDVVQIESDFATVTYSDVQGGWDGTGNINADPCFVGPGYWDGNGVWIEGDYHLLPYSPCINAGTNTPEGGLPETDIDGEDRVMLGGVDMGADEFNPFEARFAVVNRARVERTVFEYECEVTLENTSRFVVKNVQLEMVKASENMAIVDPNVTFGDIEIAAGGSATSTDTCIFQVDRAQAIEPAKIIWWVRCDLAGTGQTMEHTGSSAVSGGVRERSRRPFR